MNITIVGAGYVGLSTAAILANTGNTVTLIDLDEERLNAIQAGHSFFYEEGIDPLIAKAINDNTLLPTNQYDEGVKNADVVFSCVGTPDQPDGSSNLEYVFAAAQSCAELMRVGSVYIQKSTVPVVTGKRIQEHMNRSDISYVSNPEFLREGTAIADSINFDRVVCGGDDPAAIELVFKLFREVEDKRQALCDIAKIKMAVSTESTNYITTTLESAELIKVTANAFLALKISFANSIAMLADKVGADVVEVMSAVGQDKRIGRAFLNAGRGYGGGCFPKDVSGLISALHQHESDASILEAAQKVNQSMPEYIISKLHSKIENLSGKKIAVLGLAFKAGTSDTRKSPGIAIANLLSASGTLVHAYDPKANDEAAPGLNTGVKLESSAKAALEGSEVVLITTEWDEFKQLDLGMLGKMLSGKKLVLDCMNILNPSTVRAAGLQYLGIGR